MALVLKNLPANARNSGDMILGSGRSPGGGHGSPVQYSCLEDSTDRGLWQATVHGVTLSQTRLKWLGMHVLQPESEGKKSLILTLSFCTYSKYLTPLTLILTLALLPKAEEVSPRRFSVLFGAGCSRALWKLTFLASLPRGLRGWALLSLNVNDST